MRRAQLWATIGAVAATLLLTTAAPAAAESGRAQPAAPATASAVPTLFGDEVRGTFSRGGVPVLPRNALDDYPCYFGSFGCREPVLDPGDLRRGDTALTYTVDRAPLSACYATGDWLSVRFEDDTWGPMEGLVPALAVDLGSAEPGWC
ncbi:hypothetical protein [Pseudonocardia humida]|uniref:Peptidase inhibitor family I36 n=1 Tax=Pseudonocardia humida TaxID=2800819 RepID=A0ABT1A9Z8_9PSEU|nr:hypothetical protein [Pseudonocardia humida]MCO1659862.1 hypothetical protein [Pseudonocardia humida]